ncbi:MAG TPA: hypothetical protein VN408_17025 [Actinoplanes sp.]|nr:hypothetical protein [Actinoplanes sp.]
MDSGLTLGSGHRAVGATVSVVGQALASAPWLSTVVTFVRHTAPDSVFMTAVLTGLLQLLLFAVCMTLAFVLRRAAPDVARGVVSGWLGGLLAIPCGGTAVIGFLATMI